MFLSKLISYPEENGVVLGDDYNELLKKYDKLFMEKMGIENEFCIYHVLHWIFMDSGMEYEGGVKCNDGNYKSGIRVNGIDKEIMGKNVKKYGPSLFERVYESLFPELSTFVPFRI